MKALLFLLLYSRIQEDLVLKAQNVVESSCRRRFQMQMLILFVIFVYNLPQSLASNDLLTVMTMNTWNFGLNVDNGLSKIAKHIERVNPDIIALQEVRSLGLWKALSNLLGRKWRGATRRVNYPDVAILTRHKLVEDSMSYTNRAIGGKVALFDSNTTVCFWSFHLDHRSYGPYAANNKLVTNAKQIMAGESNTDGNGRFENVREILLNDYFQASVNLSDEEPLIVAGDFNTPSHLDWTEDTKNFHGGWVFEWPTTKILQKEALLTDSYREVHPDVIKHPGITWSTVEKKSAKGWKWTIPEPQDRIDFIFYRSPFLEPIFSYTYKGRSIVRQMPNHYYNDYPSDHYAVITKFAIRNKKF